MRRRLLRVVDVPLKSGETVTWYYVSGLGWVDVYTAHKARAV